LCPSCGKRLNEIVITPEDHEKLKHAIVNNIMIGKNSFSRSTPKEVDDFLKLLRESKPFDIIVDGLNVAYSIPNTPWHVKSGLVVNVVKSFVKDNKRVLVIGRQHMKKWGYQAMNYLKNNSTLYLLDDL
jgi:mitochondrial ribonuclease P protein 3